MRLESPKASSGLLGIERHDLNGGVPDLLEESVERRSPSTGSPARDRADWPKITCVMPSRLANAMRPSAGRSALTRTTVAPRRSASATLRRALRDPRSSIRPGASRGVSTYTAYQRAPRRPAIRAPVRRTRGAPSAELIQTITRSGISAGSSPSRCRYERRLLAHFVGDRAQRQLAQRRQVALAGRSA